MLICIFLTLNVLGAITLFGVFSVNNDNESTILQIDSEGLVPDAKVIQSCTGEGCIQVGKNYGVIKIEPPTENERFNTRTKDKEEEESDNVD